MERIHKSRNDFNQNYEENIRRVLTSTTSNVNPKIQVETDINSKRTSLSEEGAKHIKNTKRNYESSKIETNTETTTSCTSSTDSGVNISDNDEIPTSPSTNRKAISANHFNKKFYKNLDSDKNNSNCNYNVVVDNEGCEGDENYSTNFNRELKSRMQKQKLTQHLKAADDERSHSQANQNFIDSENVKKVNQQRNLLPAATVNNDNLPLQHNGYINKEEKSISAPPSPSLSSSLSVSSALSSEISPSSKVPNFSSSPVVSILSISSSIIITSDSDSDSDSNADIEGVHENYVIKKLGTQVTFPPKHPEIPNINSGHTLLNQKVQINNNQQQPSPLAALAAIGDTFGQAQALGAVPSVSQRPQIGSIALSNSSDVTFGDKHFYEGPVTIQQFLIDSRDKWKDDNGKDNPTFVNENSDNLNNAKDINSSSEKSSKIRDYIFNRRKVFIPGVLAIAALIIVGTIFGVLQNESKSKLILRNSEESRKNIPINSTIDSNTSNIDNEGCSVNSTLCLIKRDVWRAHPQKNTLDKQKLPLKRAIISHTASEACDSLKICSERVRVIQEFHMNSFGWDDIGYNFLISSDGRVYEGRGWDAIGAHTKGYNTGSVGITFIGTYMSTAPTEAQLNACLALLDEGLRLNKLAENYHVYGARQFAATESPGDMLYRQIKKWKRWSSNININ